MTRRGFIGAFALAAVPVRSFRLRAIAAERLPQVRTICSMDPRVADHFARGGVFEIREYPEGSRILLHDSLESRWAQPAQESAPQAISLYVPA